MTDTRPTKWLLILCLLLGAGLLALRQWRTSRIPPGNGWQEGDGSRFRSADEVAGREGSALTSRPTTVNPTNGSADATPAPNPEPLARGIDASPDYAGKKPLPADHPTTDATPEAADDGPPRAPISDSTADPQWEFPIYRAPPIGSRPVLDPEEQLALEQGAVASLKRFLMFTDDGRLQEVLIDRNEVAFPIGEPFEPWRRISGPPIFMIPKPSANQ